MKVHELLSLLQQCDPQGEVSFNLPMDIVDGTAGNEGMSYVYVPVVEALWSTSAHYADRLADRVNFSIPALSK